MSTEPMSREAAKAAADAARRAYGDLQQARDARIRAAREAIGAEFAESLLAASRAARGAEAALLAATDRETADHEWEGRKVFRTVVTGPRWAPVSKREDGVVETVRSASNFAVNLSRYSRPRIGDVIVRILKKDGTPGVQFKLGLNGWRPVS